MEKKEKSSFITNWILVFCVVGIIDIIVMNFVPMSSKTYDILAGFSYIYIILAACTILTLVSITAPDQKDIF